MGGRRTLEDTLLCFIMAKYMNRNEMETKEHVDTRC